MKHRKPAIFLRSSTLTWTAGFLITSLLTSANAIFAETGSKLNRRGNQVVMHRPIIIPSSYDELNRNAAGVPDRVPVGTYFDNTPGIATLNWSFLGPRPIESEYWSGEDDASGRISSIIVNPSNPDIVYLAAAQGGVWKSTDGGTNWAVKTDFISSLASGALAFDPTDTDVIFYGTGELHYSGDCQYGDGLFRTTDAGETWVKIAEKATIGSYVSRIIADPQNPNIIHLGSDLGYLRSTDGGITWNNILNQTHCNDLASASSVPAIVFAAMHGIGVYRSTNSGASWNLLQNGLPNNGFARINLAISESNPAVVYASFIANDGSLYGMYKTSNAGSNWSQLVNTPNYVLHQGWYDNCVQVDPFDSDICFAGGVFPYNQDTDYGLIMTTDGGNSWTDITIGQNGQVHPDHHCLAMGPDRILWIGCDGGIWKTSDHGVNWINRNHTLGVTQFYNVAIHPTNQNFLLGGTQDNGTARYEGLVGWPQLSAGDGGPSAIEWDSPNIYYSTYVQMRYLSRWDNGVYQNDVTGPWEGERASWCNGPLTIDPNQPDAMLAGTYRAYRTTNSGDSWSLISGDLTGGGVLRALAIAFGNSNVIYSGSSDGRVYVTTDGANWNNRSSGLPGSTIPSIYIDPSNWQAAYICSDRSSSTRVFYTSNAGINWTSRTGDLPYGLRGKSLAVDFSTDPPGLFLGTDYGLYSSMDNGAHWTKDSANLPNVEIYDMRIDSYNNLLTVATHGRGMFRTTLANPQDIPTLSQWGLLIMGMMLMLFITIVLIRKKRIFLGEEL